MRPPRVREPTSGSRGRRASNARSLPRGRPVPRPLPARAPNALRSVVRSVCGPAEGGAGGATSARSSRSGRSTGSASSGSSCRTCTGSPGRRRSRSPTPSTTRSAGSTCTAASSVLDSRSDVVPGTLYHEERRVRRPAPVPRSRQRRRHPVGRPHGPSDLRRAVVRRLAARGDAPARLPQRAREGREMGFEPLMGSEFEFYLLDRRHARTAVRGLPHLQHGPERLRPDDPPHPRGDAAGRRRHHHRRTASTPARSGRSTSRPGGAWPARTTRSRSRTA